MAGFVLVEDRVLDSVAASITFNAGLTDYTKFRLTLYVIKDGSAGRADLRFNGDSGSNYATQRVSGEGSTVTGARLTGQAQLRATYLSIGANSPALATVEISKPLSSTPARAVSQDSVFNTNVLYTAVVGEWDNTADLISSITIFASSGNFAVGTRAVLEGAPGTAPVIDEAVRLVVGDEVQGEDYSTGAKWPEDYETVDLGPISLAGVSAAQVNDNGLGAALAAEVPDGEAEVDALPLQVSYDTAVAVSITAPTDTIDRPNATLEWDAEVGGSPVTQASYRVTGRVQPSNALVYDSGVVASATQAHQIGSGTPVLPWASPQNGQTVRWTVTVVEDGTADPDGVGPAIEGSASVDLVNDWTPPPAPTGFAVTAVTEEV